MNLISFTFMYLSHIAAKQTLGYCDLYYEICNHVATIPLSLATSYMKHARSSIPYSSQQKQGYCGLYSEIYRHIAFFISVSIETIPF